MSRERTPFFRDYRTYRIGAVLWMAFIFWLSSRSDLPSATLFWGQDKVAHAVLFGILGLLYARSLGPWRGGLSRREIFLVTCMVAGYGLLDEWHQSFIPGRDASVADLAADALGGFTASAVLRKG
jgi:hypothetical protein